jgi:hypothetical protein
MDDQQRAGLLGELATQAGMERSSFLDEAAEQFIRFLETNRERLADIGGLVLIDDDPEYLAVTAEGTFRSKSRFQDDDGAWVSETEEIESGAELVEIYNPADLYAAFAEAARDEAGLDPQPTGAEDLLETAGIAPSTGVEQEPEAEPDEAWLDRIPTPTDKPEAARYLYDLALTFQERSQRSEARLLEEFEDAAGGLAAVYGDSKVAEDEDERLYFKATGAFEAEVVPEYDENDEPVWQTLSSSEEMVQFYDPTDLFGDLAEAIADEHPQVAPELDEDEADDDGAEAVAEDDGVDPRGDRDGS